MSSSAKSLVAADIGNTRLKLGVFDRPLPTNDLPEPTAEFALPLLNRSGNFDREALAAWCRSNITDDATWIVSSVHRGAANQLIGAITAQSKEQGHNWIVRELTRGDVPLVVKLDEPERVGIDRLLGAVAADFLRQPGGSVIVVDLGTVTKLALLTEPGTFEGGAMLPGLVMSARVLEEQTDALPYVDVGQWRHPPAPLGKATEPAIEAGLFWGTLGAIRELIARLAEGVPDRPAVIVTGGAAPLVAEALASTSDFPVRHLPHLVLSGIALVGQAIEA